MCIYVYMPLVHFVLFKTTLRKTFWPYMKILSKNTSLLPPESMIPPFHILFTDLLKLVTFRDNCNSTIRFTSQYRNN